MAIASDRLQTAAPNPASVPPVMPPPFASATRGSYGGNSLGQQLAAWARTPIGLAFVLTAGTLLGFVLMKLLVLLGWAMDWSWLRDNPILRSGSDNCPNQAACLAAAGGAAGGSGGKGQPRGGKGSGGGGTGGGKGSGGGGGGPASVDPKNAPPADGGRTTPGTYTPTPGYHGNPIDDPAFVNARQQALHNNPGLAGSSPPDSGGGPNYNQMIQNWYKSRANN
jgi:hypothetical protein